MELAITLLNPSCCWILLSGLTLIAEGKMMLDQRVYPFSDLDSLEKFRDVAVVHVFAYMG